MIADPWFYVAAIPAMIMIGVSKGGFGVIGILHVPLIALVISPVQAAGITLPILVASDIVALISYRRHYDTGVLKLMVPSALIGVAIGWMTASWVSEHFIRLIVGLVAVLFAIDYWVRHKRNVTPHAPNTVKGWFWGTVTGFVSFVSHSGGPPYQVYAAPLRLDPKVFAGTQVILFAFINAVKLPPYFFLGQFDRQNLLTAAILTPVAILSVWLGVWLVRRIDPRRFYDLIYLLVFLVGLVLVWQGAGGLI
jgi:uncharacterized membrane protein YfcA